MKTGVSECCIRLSLRGPVLVLERESRSVNRIDVSDRETN
jgi:hypothetical protein